MLASSGAVYGLQPVDLSHIPENYLGAPDSTQPLSAYGEIKRVSELMCALTPDIEHVIARGFAFVGPYLPLTDKFAIGSFMRDALAGGPIRILGDGTPLRSYLYAADLAVWLLTLLVKGRPSEAYNLGSDEIIDLAGLAGAIATARDVPMEIAQLRPSGAPPRYIPAIDKARKELGLEVKIPLTAALRRTMAWSSALPATASHGKPIAP